MAVEPIEEEQTPVEVILGQLEAATQHQNLAEILDKGRRSKIASDVKREYDLDKQSMAEWRDRMDNGLDLARLIRAEKTSPWPNASNVRFPMVTSAALQFNARAYPAIVPGGEPVSCTVHGSDKSNQKANRAARVSAHMSYQLMHQIPEWEMETDALLVVLPIVGTVLRKTWFDPTEGRVRMKMCEPGAVVINDKVKSIENAPRVSEEIPLYPYEIEERKRAGLFLNVELQHDGEDDDVDAPQMFIEQHRRLDLDGDGYPEPYVVTVHKETERLVRIVANFEMEDIVAGPQGVVSIARRDYYSVFHFLPSMDGGFWGTGLGMLLGDISETINTTINQLVDSGSMSTRGAGFVANQNFRMTGGSYRFRPGEWKQVKGAGDDIRKAFVPLPTAQPSPVLFEMLGLLIEAGREIASIKDVMTGDAGSRSMPATTTLALIEQGMALFSAAYKRIYRALKEEFKMVARINVETLDPEEYAAFHDMQATNEQPGQMPGEAPMGMPGQMQIDPRADYDLKDMDITPVADPRVVTSMQSMARAQLLMELSQTGAIDPQAAVQRVLEVAHIEKVDELLPQPNPIEMELEKKKIQHGLMMMQVELEEARSKIALQLATVQEKLAKAAKDSASPEIENSKLVLEDMKMRLNGLLEMMKNDAGRPGGVAGESDNAAASRQYSQGGGPAETPDLRGVLVGSGSIGQPQGVSARGFPYPA